MITIKVEVNAYKKNPQKFSDNGRGGGVIGPGSAFAHDQFVNTEDECMLLFYLTLLVGLSEKIKEMAKGSLRMFFTSIKLKRLWETIEYTL